MCLKHQILRFIIVYIFRVVEPQTHSITPFSVTKWLNGIHASGYDKLLSPGELEGSTTEVQLRIYVEHIGNFKASSMDYDLSIFLIQHWTDTRLRHEQPKLITFSDKSQLDRLWMPDVYFSNSKMAQFNYVMVPNLNFRIWQNGRVRLGIRISMKVLCHMDLGSYPIDEQICSLKIQTCATSSDAVNLSWANTNPVTLNPEIQPTDLRVEKVEVHSCDAEYYGFSYSCLYVNFYLQRSISFSLLQTYFPTTFIVIISWISFWIDPTSVPGRVALAVTTLLTLSTQAIAMHFHLPPVDYAKALDVWFGVCILFLFFCLVEFALVNMYSRLEQQEMANRNAHPSETALISNNTTTTAMLPAAGMMKKMCQAKKYRSRALFIDRCARIIFPVTFTLFAIGYWSHYLTKM